MNLRTQFGEYTIQGNNTIESIGLHKQEERFNKLWIYPGTRLSTGLLNPNAATIYIGEDGDGQKTTPDALTPGDAPIKIELPQGEQKKISEVLIQGTAGDGVWFKYWPATVLLILMLCSTLSWGQERPAATGVITLHSPGTTDATAMVQAAINSFANKSLTGTDFIAGGGKIQFLPGTYVFSGSLTLRNAVPLNLVLEGSGKANTLFLYTGSAAAFVNTSVDSVSGPPGGASLNLVVHDIGLVASNSISETVLLRVHALNELDVDGCLFTIYERMTNGGAALNYTPSVAHTVGTVGIDAQGCNQIRVRNSSFWSVAKGINELCDHARVENSIFDDCKEANSPYTVSLDVNGTPIPKSGGIINQNGGDLILRGVHWDGVDIPVYSSGYTQNHDPVFENVVNWSVVDGTPGTGFITVYDPNPWSGLDTFSPVDTKMAANGALTASTDGRVVNITSVNASLGPLAIITGGKTVFRLDQNGDALQMSFNTGGPTWKTNATAPPGSTSVIRAWLSVTNDSGKIGKIPVYY